MRASLMVLHLVLLFFAAGCDHQTPTAPAVRLASEVRAAAGPEWGAWSNPVIVPVVNSDAQDGQPTLSPDQLSLYFASNRPGGLGGFDIWVARRASTSSAWGPPVNLGAPINSPANDQGPSLSDGLLLFFHSNRPGGQGEQDIYVSRRMNKHDDFGWGSPTNLGTDVNTSAYEAGPMFLQNAEEGRINFYFVRGPTPVDIDIYAAAITRNGETRGPAVAVSELNFPGVTDARTTMRMDAKEIVFFSTRPGGFGLADLYVATRQSVHASWSDPINLGTPVNSQFIDTQPSLSFDGATLLFSSNRPGGLGLNDIWMTTRSLRPSP